MSTVPKQMLFDPANSTPHPYPSEAQQYRKFHGETAWLFNPYSGLARDARDIGSDVFGLLIYADKYTPQRLEDITEQQGNEGSAWYAPTSFIDKQKLRESQQESEYITAAQARELGAGNAEYSYSGEIWDICDSSCKYSITHNGGLSMTKYRSIKQAQPEHPEDRYVRQSNELDCPACGGSGHKDDVKAQPKPVDEQLYCMVSKDGEPAIRMLRTEAQELQRKTKDTHDWRDGDKGEVEKGYDVFLFTGTGTYTYRTKATIKLDDNMVTPEQAAAEWEAKKETHDLWLNATENGHDDADGWLSAYSNHSINKGFYYQLRPKQPTWTGSREDVIALLKEKELIK